MPKEKICFERFGSRFTVLQLAMPRMSSNANRTQGSRTQKRKTDARKHKKVQKMTKVPRNPKLALKIRQPWLGKILSKQKTWELRSRPTNIRGSIGLIQVGSGKLVARAELATCIYMGHYSNGRWIMRSNVPKRSIKGSASKHRCTAKDINQIGYTKLYAWVLRKVVPYKQPRHVQSNGQVVWTKI